MPEAITPVAGTFAWKQTPAGKVLTSTALAPLAAHVFTTRDLAFRGGPVDPDYARLATVFSGDANDVVRVRQVHGRTIVEVHAGTDIPPFPDADAIISTDPARVIAVRVADCVPVLIADRRRRVVAAIHAGWRGTVAGIVAETVRRLSDRGVSPTDLVAAVGPSIGPCCYQVDVVVKSAFGAAHKDGDGWFADDGPGKWKLDLWRATVDQLVAAGVPRTSVSVACLCTADHPEAFYSYRRDRADGRMVAAIRVSSER